MKIFISYGRADRSFAASLRQGIERLGVSVVDPQMEIQPGESIDQKLRQIIEDSDAAVLVVPETGSLRSNWAFFEAGAAKALGKKVFVVMPNTTARELPVSVTDFAILDALRKPIDDVAKTLVHMLEAA